jgi:hypothetical protein
MRAVKSSAFVNAYSIQKCEEMHFNTGDLPFSKQGGEEVLQDRMTIAKCLPADKKITLWPDITMIGGWGCYGTYPYAQGLAEFFRHAGSPYAVMPYSEGRYDDINKFFMLRLAWNPRIAVRRLARTVLEGALCESMPEEAVEAVLLLEKRRYEEAEKLFTKAHGKVSEAARASRLWIGLEFHARYAAIPRRIDTLRKELVRLQSSVRAGKARIGARKGMARLRNELAQIDRRIDAYVRELPALARIVNGLKQKHNLGCGTRPILRKHLPLEDLNELHKVLIKGESLASHRK